MKKQQDTIEIVIPSQPRYLKVVRCAIDHLCVLNNFPDRERQGITLAVDEAVTNVIRHAYHNDPNNQITVRCRIAPDALEIVLHDFGTSADPEKIRGRELSEVRPGGLGVHLIQAYMDEVRYEPDPEKGNKLIMIKHFSSGA